MHILPRLNSFINELEPFTNSLRQEGAILRIVLKEELYAFGPDPLIEFYKIYNIAKVKYQLEDFVSPTMTLLKPAISRYESDEIEFSLQVDTLGLVKQMLRSFFHREESLVVSEGLAFLNQLGLNDEKLESELGVSKSTLWRYRQRSSSDKKGASIKNPVSI